MHKTLFARMTAKNANSFASMKKPSETMGDNQATMKTAATANDPNRSINNNATQGLGVTSPFKDAMSKGVVSGMGLLTF